MSTAGGVLFMLLLGWTIAWMFSWLFPYSTFNWALTYIGIALFVGLTAYDTKRLKEIGVQLDTHPAAGGLAVLGALTLYLDFINLFLLILRARNR
jgi:FtsH-binding integral membrane protein